MANKQSAIVKFNYYNRVYQKNNYNFIDNKTGEKYRWITTLIYSLIEGRDYVIEFYVDNAKQGEIIIKNVDIYEYILNAKGKKVHKAE